MTINRFRILILAAGLSTFTSCASTTGMLELAPEEGQARIYEDVGFEPAIEVCREAIAQNSDLVVEHDGNYVRSVPGADPDAPEASADPDAPKAWAFVAEVPANFWHWGSKVRVLVRELAPDRQSVSIVTRRNNGMNLSAPGDLSPGLWPYIDVQLGAAARADANATEPAASMAGAAAR